MSPLPLSLSMHRSSGAGPGLSWPRLAGLDGLRAGACLSVFLANLHHSMRMTVEGGLGPFDLPYFAESGVGVVMLIVLSGMGLSVPLWASLEKDPRPGIWRRFALRRVVRIVPAYYACLAAYLIVSPPARDTFDAVVHFAFVNNLWERTFYGISTQFWTIGMFAQFYLVLPFVFIALRALKLRGSWAALAVLSLSVPAYFLHWMLMATRYGWLVGPMAGMASPDGYVLSHSTLAHLPQFLFGVAGGYVVSVVSTRRDESSVRIGVISESLFWLSAAGMIALAGIPALDRLAVPYGRYLFPWMAACATVAVVALPFAPVARGMLDIAPLRWLGTISYGVYVYHMACMLAVYRLLAADRLSYQTASQKWRFAILSLGATVVVAAASYVLVERPLLGWSRRRATH